MLDWKTKEKDNPKVLLLVAHPDDETIFCGGTMLCNPHWSWNVVCVTYQHGSDRILQFQNAMEHYKSFGVQIDSYLTLEQPNNPKILTPELQKSWKNKISGLEIKPDIVFTHNTRGEYGHPYHRQLNTIVHERFDNVWEFICPGAVNIAPQPFKEQINVVPLSKEVLQQKLAIFENNYKSEQAIWDVYPELMTYEFKTGPEIFTA